MGDGEAQEATNALGLRVHRAAWEEVLSLLREGEYEAAAELIEDTEEKTAKASDPAVWTILEATRQMCLAGNDYQVEVEFHKEALQSASTRERQLRGQLLTILKLIMSPAEIPGDVADFEEERAGSAPERRAIPGLLQRLQDLLGFSQGPDGRDGRGERRDPGAPGSAPATTGERTERRDGSRIAGRPATVRTGEVQRQKNGPILAIYCLGAFRVYANNRQIENWTGNKGKSILKYLALHREQPVHRDVLIDLFWRDDEPEAARRNLYQAVYMLRQDLQGSPDANPAAEEFEHPYILCENSCYLFNPVLELYVDSETFLTHYQAGQAHEREGRMVEAIREYEAAESCYDGDLLVEDLYEEWTLMMREQLKNNYLDALDRVSRYYWLQGEFALCVTYCQEILQADRCREDVHRRLMMVYVKQGHRHLALREYHRCVDALRQELDATPMPATVELYNRIKNNEI